MCMIFAAVATACDSNPCQNGGTCRNGKDGSFVCECLFGWTGATCEEGKVHHVISTSLLTETLSA